MLYNQSTGRIPQDEQHDVIFSNESFVRWLAKKPGRATYRYHSGLCCPIAQYFNAMGRDVFVGNETYFELASDQLLHLPLPKGWNDVVQNGERTYGAALGRARRAFDLP